MKLIVEGLVINNFKRLQQMCRLCSKAILLVFMLVGSMAAYGERDSSRDQFRHPVETLSFFGITPEMNVVEISPGGGWYTEILAEYLTGPLFAAHYDPNAERAYYRNSQGKFATKMASDPALYGNVKMHIFDATNEILNTEDSSADAVVTFRNVHNWLGTSSESKAFALFFKTLKPGGILGVVEHRAPVGTDRKTMKESGYMTQDYVIELGRRAGFIFEQSSEVNANPKDTADHLEGVWTLPPSLVLGKQDREKYVTIGESDRMTLRFRKPKE
ncbi:MAG: methyltransferase domain-containing protein [Porticoccaceae bacterium]|nr:methyltransferase domain-containing protein [Porticoccaceae bacterium]